MKGLNSRWLVRSYFFSELKTLLRTRAGEALEIGTEVVLATPAFEQARDRIRVLLRRQGRATASELRQALGTSRRILIPLLEKLDRDGLTRREGDQRVLASSPS